MINALRPSPHLFCPPIYVQSVYNYTCISIPRVYIGSEAKIKDWKINVLSIVRPSVKWLIDLPILYLLPLTAGLYSACEADISGIFISEEEIQVSLVSDSIGDCTYDVAVNDSTTCDCPQVELCQQAVEKEANQESVTFSLCTPPNPVSQLSISIKPSDLNYYQIQIGTIKDTGKLYFNIMMIECIAVMCLL